MAVLRVLIVDDHAAFREPLTYVFDREPGFEVVAQAGSLAEARGVLGGVDLAVLDLDLPDGDGTDLIGELRARNPGGMALILTASADRGAHARAVEAGAAGVLHKSVGVRDVVEAAGRLAAGEPLLSVDEVAELVHLAGRRRARDREAREAIGSLTPREKDVLRALGEGLSDKEIAGRLYVSAGTVRNYVASILNKLGVHSRLQALLFAARYGVVEIG